MFGKNIFKSEIKLSGDSGGTYPYKIYKKYVKSNPPWKAIHFISSFRTISLNLINIFSIFFIIYKKYKKMIKII